MYTITKAERSVLVDAVLYSKPDEQNPEESSELRRDALDILQYEGTLPEDEDPVDV